MSTSPPRLDSVLLEREFVASAFFSPEILDRLRLPPAEFMDPPARVVLTAQLAMREAGEEIEPTTLRIRVAEMGGHYPEEIDATIPGLWSKTADKRLHDLAELRRTRDALLHALASCESGNLDATRARCGEIAKARDSADRVCVFGLGDLADQAAKDALEPDDSKRLHLGVKCINDSLGGMGVGDMVIVGADTGVGKSSYALISAFGMSEKVPVGIVSCEDPQGIWGARAAANYSGVSSLRLLSGSAAKSFADCEALVKLISDPKYPSILVDFQIGKPLSDVLASMRRMAAMGARILIIDYVQAILSDTPAAPRKDQIREIASRIKGQAQSLQVGVMLLSQLSRPEKSKAAGREPTMFDLKECGDLENMAEVILLLWVSSDDNSVVQVKIEKSKWGAVQRLHRLRRDKSGTLVEYPEAHHDDSDRYGDNL